MIVCCWWKKKKNTLGWRVLYKWGSDKFRWYSAICEACISLSNHLLNCAREHQNEAKSLHCFAGRRDSPTHRSIIICHSGRMTGNLLMPYKLNALPSQCGKYLSAIINIAPWQNPHYICHIFPRCVFVIRLFFRSYNPLTFPPCPDEFRLNFNRH